MVLDVRGFGFDVDPVREARGFAQLLGQGQLVQQQEMALQQAREQQARQQEIGSLLGQAIQAPEQRQAALTDQQRMLEEQAAEFGEVQDVGLPTQAELIAEARRIDPVMAEQELAKLGLDDASKRAEASRFAAQALSLPIEQRQSLIKQRAQEITARGGNPQDTLQLLDMDVNQQNEALMGVQMLDLATKERLDIQARRERGVIAGTSEREFNNLIKGLSPEDQRKAKRS